MSVMSGGNGVICWASSESMSLPPKMLVAYGLIVYHTCGRLVGASDDLSNFVFQLRRYDSEVEPCSASAVLPGGLSSALRRANCQGYRRGRSSPPRPGQRHGGPARSQ